MFHPKQNKKKTLLLFLLQCVKVSQRLLTAALTRLQAPCTSRHPEPGVTERRVLHFLALPPAPQPRQDGRQGRAAPPASRPALGAARAGTETVRGAEGRPPGGARKPGASTPGLTGREKPQGAEKSGAEVETVETGSSAAAER